MTANERVKSARLQPLEAPMQEMSYREAIAAALREEMRRDPKTLIMGEDIGSPAAPSRRARAYTRSSARRACATRQSRRQDL